MTTSEDFIITPIKAFEVKCLKCNWKSVSLAPSRSKIMHKKWCGKVRK